MGQPMDYNAVVKHGLRSLRVISSLLRDELILSTVLPMSMIANIVMGTMGAKSLRPGVPKVNRDCARVSLESEAILYELVSSSIHLPIADECWSDRH